MSKGGQEKEREGGREGRREGDRTGEDNRTRDRRREEECPVCLVLSLAVRVNLTW